MDRVDFFRQQVRDARELFEGTMADVTSAQALWTPAGSAMPIAGHYAHVLASQDFGLHGLVLGSVPLAMTTWEGKAGMEELPPPFGHPWDGWARQRFDLAALRVYAQAVYAATDSAFAALSEAEMSRPVDLAGAGFGQQDLAFLLVNGWVSNVNLHCGEISCLKGLQAAKGYPV